jgi:hypothetical protein
MERPHCKICRHEHYASEPHVWRARDFDFSGLPPAPDVATEDPPRPIVVDRRGNWTVDTYVSTASEKTQIEQKSRYRTPESTEAYRKYKREYMAKRRSK